MAAIEPGLVPELPTLVYLSRFGKKQNKKRNNSLSYIPHATHTFALMSATSTPPPPLNQFTSFSRECKNTGISLA